MTLTASELRNTLSTEVLMSVLNFTAYTGIEFRDSVNSEYNPDTDQYEKPPYREWVEVHSILVIFLKGRTTIQLLTHDLVGNEGNFAGYIPWSEKVADIRADDIAFAIKKGDAKIVFHQKDSLSLEYRSK
jgi:hypothetical protein